MALLGGPKTATSTQDRLRGFTNCLAQHSIEAADISFADNYSYLAGKTAMSSLLERTTVDAVFCGDDLICMGAMDAARSNGLSIPQDIGFPRL